MRIPYFLVLLLVVGMFPACQSSPENGEEDAWVGHLVAYRKAVSEERATVGYVKTFEFTHAEGGEPFHLYRVYDLSFRERGVVNDMGVGTKYIDLPPEIGRAKQKSREIEELPAEPLAVNVAKILDVDRNLKLVPVTAAELRAAGE